MTAAFSNARRAARVLLLDERDRALLFRGMDPADPAKGSWWITPGGGVDCGESLSEAALRELTEESGISEVQLGPCIWTRQASFSFEGATYHQEEWFFAARTTTTAVRTDGFTNIERRSVLEHRWWTVDELRTTREVVYPEGLGRLIESYLRDGPPAAPVEIR